MKTNLVEMYRQLDEDYLSSMLRNATDPCFPVFHLLNIFLFLSHSLLPAHSEKRKEFHEWQANGGGLPVPDDDGCTLVLNIFDKKQG